MHSGKLVKLLQICPYSEEGKKAQFVHVQVPSAESQAALEIAASLVVDADRPDAAAKDAQSASILMAVYTQANDTLAAIRQTAAALDAVERAAAAVERAKDRHDDTVRRLAGNKSLCLYDTVGFLPSLHSCH